MHDDVNCKAFVQSDSCAGFDLCKGYRGPRVGKSPSVSMQRKVGITPEMWSVLWNGTPGGLLIANTSACSKITSGLAAECSAPV